MSTKTTGKAVKPRPAKKTVRKKAVKKTTKKAERKTAKKAAKKKPAKKLAKKVTTKRKLAKTGVCADARKLMATGKYSVSKAVKLLAPKYKDATEGQLKRVCWVVAHSERQHEGKKAVVWKPSPRGPAKK